MTVYIDSEGRILAVGETDDDTLIEVEINDENNPFKGWSDAKIMCYRIQVDEDGNVIMMTPYVPSNLIDKISQMQTAISELAEGAEMVEETLDDVLAVELPEHTISIADIEETVDFIMTEVLPGLMS